MWPVICLIVGVVLGGILISIVCSAVIARQNDEIERLKEELILPTFTRIRRQTDPI